MSVRVRQVSSGKPNMMKQPKHEDKEQLRLLARQPQKHPLSKETAASQPVLVEVLLQGSSRRRCIPLCTAHTLAMSQPVDPRFSPLHWHEDTDFCDTWWTCPPQGVAKEGIVQKFPHPRHQKVQHWNAGASINMLLIFATCNHQLAELSVRTLGRVSLGMQRSKDIWNCLMNKASWSVWNSIRGILPSASGRK